MKILDVFVFEKSELGADERIVDSFIDIANDIAESVGSSALFFTSYKDFIIAYNAGLELLSFRLWIHYMYRENNPKNSKGYRTAKKISEQITTLKINLLTRNPSPRSVSNYNAYCTDDVIDLIKESDTSVPYNSLYSKHKVFISHSSKDSEIVKGFINKILGNGLGFDIANSNKDIYCTSIEELGIKTGADFRQNIKEHLINANIIFLFLSESYLNSEICLNEMGASWAHDKTIFPMIIPPMDFKGVGALMEINECVKLDSEDKLLKVCDELNEIFQLQNQSTKINRAIKSFIKEHIES